MASPETRSSATTSELAGRLHELARQREAGIITDDALVRGTTALLRSEVPTAAVGAMTVPNERPPSRDRRKPRPRRPVAFAVMGVLTVGAVAAVVWSSTRPVEDAGPSRIGTVASTVQTPSPTVTPDPAVEPSPAVAGAPAELFEAAVWPDAIDPSVQEPLYRACLSGTGDRCPSAMSKLGASDEAVAFYQDTGLILFATYPGGAVDIGLVAGPLGANFAASPVVLLPDGARFSADELVPSLRLKGDEALGQLRAAYPDATPWVGGAVEIPVRRPDGGTDVTFQYPLTDACHACEHLATLRVTLSFDADGKYSGKPTLRVCSIWNFELGIDAPYCPVELDAGTPTSTSATTPHAAVQRLVDAWIVHDPVAAAEVAGRDAVSFMWELHGRNVEAGRCWRSRIWEEFSCSLGFTRLGVPSTRVVALPEGGYFVAVAGYSE